MKKDTTIYLTGGVILLLIGAGIGLMIPRIKSSGNEKPNPAVVAELEQLELQKIELEAELRSLSLQAEIHSARIRNTPIDGSSRSVLSSLDDMKAASDRQLRSDEILSVLVKIQERINMLSGVPSQGR